MVKRLDLIGQRFGKLKVLSFSHINKDRRTCWNCLCDCGNEKTVAGKNLKSGTTRGCGCFGKLDLVGKKYGRLLVLNFDHVKKRHSYWNCLCDCGAIKVINGTSLTTGHTKSCGCLRREKMIEETKQKIRDKTMGNKNHFFGKKHSRKVRRKISEANKGVYKGELSPHWKSNLTDEDRQDRRILPEYKKWRLKVYERDNYTCQKCGNKGGVLNAHHLEAYRDNPELRTSLLNGITLCEACHKDFHHQYGYGKNTREQFNKFCGRA